MTIATTQTRAISLCSNPRCILCRAIALIDTAKLCEATVPTTDDPHERPEAYALALATAYSLLVQAHNFSEVQEIAIAMASDDIARQALALGATVYVLDGIEAQGVIH